MNIESSINALITRRLIEFHDALVERGQIAAAPRPAVGGIEIPDLQTKPTSSSQKVKGAN